MSRQRTFLFVAVAVVAMAAGALTGALLKSDPNTTEAGAGPAALLGSPRPPFTLGAADGRRVSAEDFDGQVMLINFWATWCAPCRDEMPMLNEVQAELGPAGLAIVGIALDDVARARGFAAELGIDYTILLGAGDVMTTSLAYGNQAGLLPYTVLVDREGVVRWVYLGELKRDTLVNQIMPLL